MTSEEMAVMFGTALVTNVFWYTIKDFYLNKNSKIDRISKIELPPEIISNTEEIDPDRIMKQRFGELILNFAKTLDENFARDDLNLFYDKINSVRTRKRIYSEKDYKLGEYNPITNIIFYGIREPRKLDDIGFYHELFHLATTFVYSKYKYMVGFEQSKYDVRLKQYHLIGKGLNEGYTELLAQRFFAPKGYYNSDYNPAPYDKQTIIAGAVERVVGKEQMQKLFLHADLKSLTMELYRYVSEKEIINFLKDCDYTVIDEDKKNEEELIIRYKKIFIFLLKAYSNKLNALVSTGIMSREEATINFNFYTANLYYISDESPAERLKYINFELVDLSNLVVSETITVNFVDNIKKGI